MSFRLNHQDFINRAKDLSRSNLLFIFSIIKAASIGIGVTTFLEMFLVLPQEWDWNAVWDGLPKGLLWVTSYGALLVTYDVAMLASLFLTHIPKKSETFFTFLLVGLEGLQFAILKPLENNKAEKIMGATTVTWWYVIFAIYCLTIFALIHFGKKDINSKLFGYASIIVERYKQKFKYGKRFALIGTILSTTVVLLLKYSHWDPAFIIITSSNFFILLLFIVFLIHHQQRKIIEEEMQKLKKFNSD